FLHATRPLHLLTDVLPEQVAVLKKQGVRVLPALPSRRVYFLAVNHRVKPLDSENLRRALALSINRDKILTDRLPRDGPSYLYTPLNGPFPAGSWACNPKLKPLFNEGFARSLVNKAVAGEEAIELSLKYPDDDPRIESACEDIKAQVEQLDEKGPRVRLRLEKLSPHKLRTALERRDYQLAYHHHDYSSEIYWLGALFDPRPGAMAAGGSNYLGYTDTFLERKLPEAAGHRQFTRVQELMQAIHDHFDHQMPLIPLWQLRQMVAVHQDLTPVRLEAPRLFTY